MSTYDVEIENIDLNAMESFLSLSINDGSRIRRKLKWRNVQNAELKFQKQRRLGKWPAVQIKLENACN